MTPRAASMSLKTAALLYLGALVVGCADQDGADTWVSVPVAARGGSTIPSEGGILPDLTARGVKPKETICGVVRANYIPNLIQDPAVPDRVYHFLVSFSEATQLVGSGKYIYTSSYDATLPFTAIECFYFGLIPPAPIAASWRRVDGSTCRVPQSYVPTWE